MLPWSKDRDSIDRLTVGSMAKVTLANNATMYPDLLALLKSMAKYQTEDVAKPLTEVIQAAETTQAPRSRRRRWRRSRSSSARGRATGAR